MKCSRLFWNAIMLTLGQKENTHMITKSILEGYNE